MAKELCCEIFALEFIFLPPLPQISHYSFFSLSLSFSNENFTQFLSKYTAREKKARREEKKNIVPKSHQKVLICSDYRHYIKLHSLPTHIASKRGRNEREKEKV
jgi:hypothetical protein